MKSGTSSLYRYLGEHPDVFVAPAKETRYFYDPRNVDATEYARFFAGAEPKRAIGEASPDYLYQPHVAQALFNVVPDARLIALLRDPVSRAYSDYWMMRSLGREMLPFEEAIAAERVRLASCEARSRVMFPYLDRGRYLPQLQRFSHFFGRERLSVFLFDDLRHDPAAVFAATCRHLGIDDGFRPNNLGAIVNAHVEFRSRKLRRGSRHLPMRLRQAVGRVNARRAVYPPMDPAVRRRLERLFEPDIEALASWLDRDLSSWISD
jgi:hypothetical protein